MMIDAGPSNIVNIMYIIKREMSSEISSYLMSLYLYITLLKIFLLLLAAAYSLYYTWNAGHDFSILLYLYTYSSMYKFIYIREI